MEKNYIKLIIFDIVLILFLLLNVFLSVKINYYSLILFLVIFIVLFKYIFGLKNKNYRFDKDICLNLIIVFLSFFLIYYLLGLIIGFVKTENYFTLYGLSNFIFPYLLYTVLKEILRYQMINKFPKFKLNICLVCILFILFDVMLYLNSSIFVNASTLFMFIIVNLIPAIAANIVCSYVSGRVSYIVNIFWLIIFNLYSVLLPIVTDTGIFIGALIRFLFPFVILYTVYSYFKKRNRELHVKSKKINVKFLIGEIILYLFGVIVIYLVSNLFRFSVAAIASGSMTPQIYRGDVVLFDKKINVKDLKVGQIIIYKYNSTLIIHRLVKVELVDDEYYFYTKGDANEATDNYIVYENMIIGVVLYKIPYVGLPAVWVSEI